MTESEQGKSAENKGDRLFSYIGRFLTVATVLVSVGGIFLHLCGYVAQRTYLRVFNVDPDGFSREADWMMVNGYYTAAGLGVDVVQSFFSIVSLWLFVYILIVVFALRFFSMKESPEWLKKLRAHVSNQSSKIARWTGFLLDGFMTSALFWAAGYLLVMVAFLVALMPGVVGEKYGEKTARQQVALYEKGCLASNPCSELWKDDKKVVEGFVIATSSEYVVLFDVKTKAVRQLERSGYEIRAPIRPVPASKKREFDDAGGGTSKAPS